MSQSARKRSVDRLVTEDSTPLDERIERLAAGGGTYRSNMRLLYRIGERLRPCPGCKNCGYEPTVKLWMLRRGLWCYGSLGVRDISRICHGNGIVPARKARKARG